MDYRDLEAVHSITPELLVDTMAEGVVVLDTEFRICLWNPAMAEMTGHSSEEALGKPASWLRAPDCTSNHVAALTSDGRTPAVDCINGCECRMLGRDGSSIPVLVNGRLLRGSSGDLLGILQTVTDFRPVETLRRQVEDLRAEAHPEAGFRGMVGHAKPMLELFRLLRLAAGSDATVVISGESGTGKELAASAVHSLSVRSGRPFVRVNCGALTESLLESELFGHVKGAFTGAYRDRPGRFEAANGGTIFLDEIGEISPAMQVKLLRVLQQGEFERVGDIETRTVDVRVIAATNRDLPTEVREGRFREDLYYRLRVFPVRMPSLRERREDIPVLVSHFVRHFARKTARGIEAVDSAAMAACMRYDWPGNVRELENALEYAFVVCDGSRILPEHLPGDVRDPVPGAASASASPEPGRGKRSADVRDPERLMSLLRDCDWNKAEVARRLGISRTAVWKWMNRHGLPSRPQ